MHDHTWLIQLEKDLTNRERDLTGLSADEQFALIKSRTREFVDGDRLLHQLKRSKDANAPLLVKYGIDPTARDIHLGHIVPIVVARRFHDMGHRIVLVFGDFTARIGDPSGRVSVRPVLTDGQIAENVKRFKEQVGKFIDVSSVEIVFNSSFYDPKNMSIADFLTLLGKNSIAPILQREDFRKRQEIGLSIAEVLYPTLMAIDSMRLGAQIELGGIDQLLNFQTAKTFMVHDGMEPETAVTTDLLESTAGDGKKMSKSEGNYIALTATADDAYGKIMSIPDRLMEQYFKLLTDITDEQWEALVSAMSKDGLSPKVVKQLLARVIVTWLHSAKEAAEAEGNFTKVFSEKKVPDDLPITRIQFNNELTWADVADACKMAASRSAFQRLVSSKAVSIASEHDRPITDRFEKVAAGEYTIRYGKGKFARIVVE